MSRLCFIGVGQQGKGLLHIAEAQPEGQRTKTLLPGVYDRGRQSPNQCSFIQGATSAKGVFYECICRARQQPGLWVTHMLALQQPKGRILMSLQLAHEVNGQLKTEQHVVLVRMAADKVDEIASKIEGSVPQ